jgi:hypothetical protein
MQISAKVKSFNLRQMGLFVAATVLLALHFPVRENTLGSQVSTANAAGSRACLQFGTPLSRISMEEIGAQSG